MKNFTQIFLAGIILLAGLFLSLSSSGFSRETASEEPKIRVGVFDSRIVALAYFRSAEPMQRLNKMHQELKAAKASKDEERVRELEQEGPWTQIRMHQQVFSNAGVSNILKKVSDEFPAIAREAKVQLIVSKWDMPYSDPAVEWVDVTLPIARLFKPDAATLKIIEQMKDQPPVPFDELPLDPRM